MQRSPLLSYEWFFSAVEAFHKRQKLYILAVFEGKKLQAIAPLVVEIDNGINYLKIIGVSKLYEPAGFLYHSENYLIRLLDHLLISGYPLLLQRISFSQTVFEYLKKKSKYQGILSIRQTAGSFYLPIRTDWPSFYNQISSRRRYDHRRALKRAEKIAVVNLNISSPDMNELDECLADAFRIEAAGWKGEKRSAILYNEKIRDFFTIYLHEISLLKLLRIAFVSIGNERVAMLIGLEHSGKFWVLKIGYDESYAHCSPGILLMYLVLEQVFKNKLDSFEFLGSAEEWISVWNPSLHPYFSMVFFPYSLKGMIAFGQESIRFGLRKLRN